MSGNKIGVTGKIREIASPIVEELGCSLWDVTFTKEGPYKYLRIYIDKADGVTTEDCEAVSRALDEPIDTLDPINEAYFMEVCSPGIQRKLVRKEHFEKYSGFPVIIKLVRPEADLSGEFTAVLQGHDGENIEISLPGGDNIKLSKKNIAFVKLDDYKE